MTTSSMFLGKVVYRVKKSPVSLQNSGQMLKPASPIIYTDSYCNLSRVTIPRRGGVWRYMGRSQALHPELSPMGYTLLSS